ncbi:MAG: ATP-binding protein [Anaerolineales bacterium]|jgi:signal transduction histidine kinase
MRLRLFLAFSLVIIVTLGTLAYISRNQFVEAVNTFAQRGGFFGVDILASSLEDYYAANKEWDNVEVIFQKDTPSGSVIGFQQGNRGNQPRGVPELILIDTNGAILYAPEGLGLITPPSEEEIELGIPLHNEEQIIGYLVPQNNIILPRNIHQTNFTPFLNQTLLPTLLISIGLALALAMLVSYYFLQPVRNLTLAANKLAKGDLTQRVNANGNDELGLLGKTFNQMAASLEHAEESRRSMTTDIAHELRTPLAVQRANLEALQDGVYPLTMENLDPIFEQNQLLTRLVEDLRTLSQTDYNDLTLEIHEYDLIPLLEQIISNYKPQADQHKITLEYIFPASCQLVNIDARRINQVLNNLLQNALQHTPEGGKIYLTLDCQESSVEMSLRDTGPGIPQDELPYIFNRFYRGKQSRIQNQSGSGIGLTIARRLVEAHGGTLTAENHHKGGAIFKVNLPR